MNWAEIYDSGWQHPGLAWLGCGAAALVVATSRGPLRGFVAVTTVLTAVDALFTGALSPLGKDSAWLTPVSVFFVIAGDARLWLLIERQAAKSWRGALPTALALTLLVPLLQGVSTRAWPELFTEPRRIYLVYEALMVVLLLVVAARRRPTGGVRVLFALFLAQYVTWALCDVLILSGATWALGLRMVPNALYYAVFPLVAALTVGREERT